MKVERVGNLNYPEVARQNKLYGSLILTVFIRADGSVETLPAKARCLQVVPDWLWQREPPIRVRKTVLDSFIELTIPISHRCFPNFLSPELKHDLLVRVGVQALACRIPYSTLYRRQ